MYGYSVFMGDHNDFSASEKNHNTKPLIFTFWRTFHQQSLLISFFASSRHCGMHMSCLNVFISLHKHKRVCLEQVPFHLCFTTGMTRWLGAVHGAEQDDGWDSNSREAPEMSHFSLSSEDPLIQKQRLKHTYILGEFHHLFNLTQQQRQQSDFSFNNIMAHLHHWVTTLSVINHF